MPLLARQINLTKKTFQVGDRVIWTQCPATMSYVEKWFPLQIVRCDREMITLDVLAFPVPASELKLAVA